MVSAYDRVHIADILAGHGDWFTAHLLRLCAKADRENLAKLRLAFPEAVRALEDWRNGVPEEFPFTATLIVEGEESTDGRTVAVGALTWETPIPLQDHGLWTEGGSAIVGCITSIHRAGNLIRGSGSANKDVTGKPLAAEITIDEWEIGDALAEDGGSVTVKKGTLRQVALVPVPAFPAARVDSDG